MPQLYWNERTRMWLVAILHLRIFRLFICDGMLAFMGRHGTRPGRLLVPADPVELVTAPQARY